MKIVYLLLLIGNIITASSHNNIYDIIDNKEYEIEVSKFPQNYIPASTSFYFRIKVEQSERYKVKVKVIKNAIIDFKLDICGFGDCPSDIQILNGHDGCVNRLKYEKENLDNYDSYVFDYDTLEGIDYLGIHLQNFNALDYLSVNVTNQFN